MIQPSVQKKLQNKKYSNLIDGQPCLTSPIQLRVPVFSILLSFCLQKIKLIYHQIQEDVNYQGIMKARQTFFPENIFHCSFGPKYG